MTRQSKWRAAPLDATSFVFDGQRFGYLAVQLDAPNVPSSLTLTERDVALRAVAGESAAQIARARNTSRRTVEHQLQAIYRKLGVAGRSELGERLYGVAAER